MRYHYTAKTKKTDHTKWLSIIGSNYNSHALLIEHKMPHTTLENSLAIS